MLKRIVPTVAAVAAVLALPAGVALAHDHAVDADCDGLSVEMWNYSTDPANTNTVDIWINGSSVVSGETFGATYSFFQGFDGTTDYTYQVKVVATMFPQATFDTGEQVVECAEAAPTSTTSTTTTAAPTTSTTTTTLLPPPASASSTTTTAVGSGGGEVTTTTVVAPAGGTTAPPAPSGAQSPGASPSGGVASSGGSLPSTGGGEGVLALVALASVLAGAALIRLTSMRPARHGPDRSAWAAPRGQDRIR